MNRRVRLTGGLGVIVLLQRARVNVTQTKLIYEFSFEAHSDLLGHSYRRRVARSDEANESLKVEGVGSVADDGCCCFSGETLTPARLVNEESQFDLVFTVDLPGQQTASSEKVTGAPFDGCPQSELGVLRVTVKEPLKLLLGFFARARSVGEVSSHLGIAIERKQRVKVFWYEAPKRKSRCFEDHHCSECVL